MLDKSQVFARTAGRCHICGKTLSLCNYAEYGRRGAWEIEHSVPRANGGTDHGNNLYPACIKCNRAKGTRSSRAARAEGGRTAAPMSVVRQDAIRARRAVGGGVLGVGLALFAGIPVFGSMVVLALAGYLLDPES